MKRGKSAAALLVAAALAVTALASLSGCKEEEPGAGLERYDTQFLSLFDTVTSIVGYTKDEETFKAYAQELYDELSAYHQLYDIYNDYEGIANIKTINDQAGIAPVEVDRRIIDLLKEAVEMNEKTGGSMNVAMGSVLSIWHEYRTEGTNDPAAAKLPSMEELKAAAGHTDISRVIIDEEASTVYLPDKEMSLDVGSVAKGYAAEMACRKLEEDGLAFGLVSVGGNVRAIGGRADGTAWKVGIQNPDLSSETKYLHTVDVRDMSLVTSGVYQRYYTVDGKNYHHIIHPERLMPWDEYASVSILCKDSGMADCLSTAVFNMEFEEGKAFIEGLDDVEAMWIFKDGTEEYSSGFRDFMEEGK